jgi:hypothetical protein
MQHDADPRQCVRRCMLGDTPRRLRHHLIRDDAGTDAPALISRLIDVAVIAGKVTTTVDLQDHLTDRNSGVAAHAKPASLNEGGKTRGAGLGRTSQRFAKDALHSLVDS